MYFTALGAYLMYLGFNAFKHFYPSYPISDEFAAYRNRARWSLILSCTKDVSQHGSANLQPVIADPESANALADAGTSVSAIIATKKSITMSKDGAAINTISATNASSPVVKPGWSSA